MAVSGMLLAGDELHGSLQDPVLGSLGFLNEVMSRYPEAISFAPGAPHPQFLENLEPEKYIHRFIDHLTQVRGYSPERARRLLYEYGPSRGLINDLVSDALRRDHGIDAGAAATVITVGAQEAMLLTLRALFRGSGDLLAVASPCFVGIVGAARLLDIDVVGVDETADGIDLAGLIASCAAARRGGGRIRAFYVAPDFSNPGGTRISMECRRRLLELAAEQDFLIIEDSTYHFTSAGASSSPPLKALDCERRVIHIGTFAKVCFPGARVGYLVADQRIGSADGRLLADELAELKTMVTVNTSPLCQAVIGGMLLEQGGSLAALGRGRAEVYQRNLSGLLRTLDRHRAAIPPEISWNRPGGGFFVRMQLPVTADLALLEISAAQYGVLWTPMSPFYLDGGGDREIRLSCSYLSSDQIQAGVHRLVEFLDKEIRA